MQNDATGHWAIAYHADSYNPRSRKWYRLARVAKVDGKWWDIGRHETINGTNRQSVRDAALNAGFELLHGLFFDAPTPRYASQLVWSRESDNLEG